MSTDNVQKVNSSPSCEGLKKDVAKISQNALMGTLFEQLTDELTEEGLSTPPLSDLLHYNIIGVQHAQLNILLQ